MTEPTQGVLLYTQEELDTKVAEATRLNTHLISDRHESLTLGAFKAMVSSGEMDNDDATGIYNAVAEANGWSSITSLKQKYTVTVSAHGEDIATFYNIEADDEDDACDRVENNLSVEEIEVSVTLDFDGTTESGTYSPSTWSYDLDLSFSAEVE